MRGEVRLENLQALSRGHARSVVAHIQKRFLSTGFFGDDMDFAASVHRLNGIEQEVEERLPKQLLVRFHRQILFSERKPDSFVFEIAFERTHDFADDSRRRDRGAPHLMRLGIIDEFIELRGDSITLNCSDSDAAVRALLMEFPAIRDLEITGAALEDAFLQLTAASEGAQQ